MSGVGASAGVCSSTLDSIAAWPQCCLCAVVRCAPCRLLCLGARGVGGGKHSIIIFSCPCISQGWNTNAGRSRRERCSRMAIACMFLLLNQERPRNDRTFLLDLFAC